MRRLSRPGACALALLILAGCRNNSRVREQPAPLPPLAAQRSQPPGPKLEIAENTPPKIRPSEITGQAPAPPIALAGGGTTPAAQPPGMVVRGVAPTAPEANAIGAPVTPPPPPVEAASDSVTRTTVPVSPPTASPTQPAADAKPQAGMERIRALYDQAATKYENIRDYSARVRIREVVDGKQQPEHILQMKFAKPFSVYAKWVPGTTYEGREVCFVKGKFNNQIQVRSGKGDLLSGIRTSVDPMATQATKGSRRTILDSGLGNLVERFANVVATVEQGKRTFGTLEYLGTEKRPESAVEMECVLQVVPPGLEKHLPQGGKRYWYFNMDPRTKDHGLPVLLITLDPSDRAVEYYCYDRVMTNLGLGAQDFDPEYLWGRR